MKLWNSLVRITLLLIAFGLNPAIANEPSQPSLNINNASIEQFEKMKGIGNRKAQAIVEYRLQNGNFTEVDDLIKVKGIGSTFVNKNRIYLTVQ